MEQPSEARISGMPYCLCNVCGWGGRGAVCQQTLWVVNVVKGASTYYHIDYPQGLLADRSPAPPPPHPTSYRQYGIPLIVALVHGGQQLAGGGGLPCCPLKRGRVVGAKKRGLCVFWGVGLGGGGSWMLPIKKALLLLFLGLAQPLVKSDRVCNVAMQ